MYTRHRYSWVRALGESWAGDKLRVLPAMGWVASLGGRVSEVCQCLKRQAQEVNTKGGRHRRLRWNRQKMRGL